MLKNYIRKVFELVQLITNLGRSWKQREIKSLRKWDFTKMMGHTYTFDSVSGILTNFI